MGRKEKISIYTIGALLLFIFTFKDLQISNIFYTNNIYGRFFEILGELPFLFLVVFGSLILYKTLEKKGTFKNKLLKIVYFLLLIIFSLTAGIMVWTYLGDNLGYKPSYIIILVIVLILMYFSNLLYNKIPENLKKEAIQYAVIAIVYFLLVIIIMNVLKTFWGRLRLREMENSIIEFTPWYIRNFRGSFSNKFASFPSGHTMNSTGIILISLLPKFIPKLYGKEKQLRIFSYIWGINVGISRIIVGAHFASDVIVGFILSIILFNLTNFYIGKRFKSKI